VKAAAVLVVVGVVVSSAAVGLYDFRAGLLCFGVSCVSVGVWNLIQRKEQ
jgi:hypothetical protein